MIERETFFHSNMSSKLGKKARQSSKYCKNKFHNQENLWRHQLKKGTNDGFR